LMAFCLIKRLMLHLTSSVTNPCKRPKDQCRYDTIQKTVKILRFGERNGADITRGISYTISRRSKWFTTNDVGNRNVNTLHCAMKLPNMASYETNTAWVSFCIHQYTKIIMRPNGTSSEIFMDFVWGVLWNSICCETKNHNIW
jgi:hypothetical protein